MLSFYLETSIMFMESVLFCLSLRYQINPPMKIISSSLICALLVVAHLDSAARPISRGSLNHILLLQDNQHHQKDTSGRDAMFSKVDVEASFKGGQEAWVSFVQKNLNADVPVRNGAPAGQYTVVVQFIVDAEGQISDIKALTRQSYGMEEEVRRVIRLSTIWEPAQQNGRSVKAYRKQPITFVVEEKTKKRRFF